MPKDGMYPGRYRAYSRGGCFSEMAYGMMYLLLPWYLKYMIKLPNLVIALAVCLFYLCVGIS